MFTIGKGMSVSEKSEGVHSNWPYPQGQSPDWGESPEEIREGQKRMTTDAANDANLDVQRVLQFSISNNSNPWWLFNVSKEFIGACAHQVGKTGNNVASIVRRF